MRTSRSSPRATTRTRPDRGTAPEASLVEARGLVKRFGELTAVDGIDFDIARGEAFGFLGPNGAGKTSTMRMIACMSPVSGGSLRVLGMDPADHGSEIRSRIGLVPQEDTLDLELTVLDNLMIYGRYFDLPRSVIRDRAQQLLEFAQLADRAHDKVDPLSGGMKRRLTIARALVSEPDLLILDEPTTGLDPQARHLLWDRLYRLKQDGVTQVITTHYMDEAEQLCDRLVVMDHGRIAAHGTPPRADHASFDARGARAPLRPRRARGRVATHRGPGGPSRGAPRSGSYLHRRRGRRARAGAPPWAPPVELDRPSIDARGRLSPSDGPGTRRLTGPGALRVGDVTCSCDRLRRASGPTERAGHGGSDRWATTPTRTAARGGARSPPASCTPSCTSPPWAWGSAAWSTTMSSW